MLLTSYFDFKMATVNSFCLSCTAAFEAITQLYWQFLSY